MDDISDVMEEMSARFDELCQKRHEEGTKEYGQFTFMGNDVVRMMAEELADTANYCRMQFVKLMLLQEVLEERLRTSDKVDEDDNITIGVKSFRGAKKGWD